jgi:CheY-like chemotaxis protein
MSKSILIVDDSEDTRELFKSTLEAEGYRVAQAASGLLALEVLATKQRFSLILLDISMPDMSGLQLLKEMKRQNLGSGVPVMLVSALDNLADIPRPANVIDVLKKPFFYPELIYKIKQVPGLKRQDEANVLG